MKYKLKDLIGCKIIETRKAHDRDVMTVERDGVTWEIYPEDHTPDYLTLEVYKSGMPCNELIEGTLISISGSDLTFMSDGKCYRVSIPIGYEQPIKSKKGK